MKTLYLNDTGDLELDGQNSLRMVEGTDEKVQSIKLLLRTNAGEWFLNTTHGLAYCELLGQKPSDELVRSVFMDAFKQEPRIEEVINFESEYDRQQRHLNVRFRVRMDGEVIDGQEVL